MGGRARGAAARSESEGALKSGELPRRRYRRWRVGSLIAVHVLFAIHFAHWKLAGRTLAPLEFSEAMHTLELGIVTAGFVFLGLTFLATLLFGRFFCGWMCHILALQDLSAWILRKLGIRPKPVRSRLLLFSAPAVMLYMFVWPSAKRIWAGEPAPELRIATDAEGWASFVTRDLWRAMPGPWIIALTFLACGFAVVYFLGSRSYCTYACPYGVLLGIADRFAPGRIVLRGDCTECGKCTAACETHIRVHQELALYRQVVSPACLKSMDCVSACPEGSVGVGFGRPALLRSVRRLGRFGVPFDCTWGEEILVALVFLAGIAVFRDLYDAVPFLATLAIAAVLAWGTLLLVRLVRIPNVRLNPFQLKLGGRLRPAGWLFATLALAALSFTVYSGFIRWHEWSGTRAFDAIITGIGRGRPPDPAQVSRARRHLVICESWGIVRPASLDRRLASLFLFEERREEAEPYVRRILERAPGDVQWTITLAAIFLSRSEVGEAVRALQAVTASPLPSPDDGPEAAALRASAHEMMSEIRAAEGNSSEAAREAEIARGLRRR